MGAAKGFHRSAAPGGRGGIEGRVTHGDDLDRIGAFDRGNGVPGVKGPLEGVFAFHGNDVRHHVHIEERGHPRHGVLAVGAVGRQHVAVPRSGLGNEGATFSASCLP